MLTSIRFALPYLRRRLALDILPRLFFAGSALIAIVSLPQWVDEQRSAIAHETDDATAMLRRAESTKVALEAVDLPLGDLLTSLREQTKLEIRVHRPSFAQQGVDENSPCSLRVRDLPLAAALDRIAAQLRIAWTVRAWGIELASSEHSTSIVFSRSWDVASLLGRVGDASPNPATRPATRPAARPAGDGDPGPNEQLLKAIRLATTPGELWDEDGGQASASLDPSGLLTVTATTRTLERIDRLLVSLRGAAPRPAANTAPPPNSPSATPPAANPNTPPAAFFPRPSDKAETLRNSLQQRTTIDFVTAPLPDVLEFLADRHKIDFVVDARALEDAGIAPTAPVTLALRDAQVRHVLDRILDDLGLAAATHDGTVWITTREQAATHGELRVYPIGDLVSQSVPATTASELDAINQRIGQHVQPSQWEENGGPSKRIPLLTTRSLVVMATPEMQDQIERLFAQWRSLRTGQPLFPITSTDTVIVSRAYTIASLLGPTPDMDSVKPKQVVALLKAELHDVKWTEPGCSIQAVGKLIMVRHTNATHRRIIELSREWTAAR